MKPPQTAVSAPVRHGGFQPQDRLLRPREFERVFKQGRRCTSPLLTALYAPNAGERSRLGFAVSKKAIPNAVGRNRVKRLIREHYRQQRHELGACDIVFMAKPAAAKARTDKLREALETCWQQLKKHCASC